ncbi:MAG: ABC transporter transmembrane domain-containing protein, partial [Treponema sp.]
MDTRLFRWAASFIKPFFPALFFLLCFSLIGNYASTFEPLFTGKIIDALTVQDRESFFYFLKIIILFQLVGLAFSLLSSWFQFLLQRTMTVYTESRLYLNLLHVPPKGSSEQDSGKLLNLFLSDLGVMTGIYTAQIPSVITSLIMMSIIGFRLFNIDVVIFSLTCIVSVIPVFLAKYFGTKQAAVNEAQRKIQDEYTAYIHETIKGLHEIKNHSAQKFFMYKFKNILKFIFIQVKESTMLGMQSSAASFFTNFIINIALFAIIGLSVLEGKNTVGTITATLMYSQKFRSLVSSCTETYKGIIVSFVSVKRLKSMFDERHNRFSIIREEKDSSSIKKIMIENMRFAYKKNTVLFKNLTAEFTFPGLYLIKGENGCGKTSLFTIISGNTSPNGETILDGSIIFSNLSAKLSYISQNPFIFSGTIKENLLFGKKADEHTIHDMLIKTTLDKIIGSLDKGLDTPLGGKGHILSQGQMQRLALSRCLLQNSEVILFDEVENALDSETSIALSALLS